MKRPIIYVLLLLFSVGVTFAAPGIPHQFYGEVYINGNNHLSDVIITVKSEGVVKASTKTTEGKYGYRPHIFYVEDPSSDMAGKTLEFYINNKKVAEYVFSNGMSTKLNLYYTGPYCGDRICDKSESSSTCSADCKETSSGGSGSSGGTSFFSTNTNTKNKNNTTDSNTTTQSHATGRQEECTPEWFCSEWTECINGIQKRVCVDRNQCNTTENKPEERQKCEIPEEQKTINNQQIENTNNKNLITGLFTMSNLKEHKTVTGVSIAVILAGAVLYLLKFRRI